MAIRAVHNESLRIALNLFITAYTCSIALIFIIFSAPVIRAETPLTDEALPLMNYSRSDPSITGTVFLPGGEPATGALVDWPEMFSMMRGTSTTVKSDGTFSFDGLSATAGQMSVRMPGYVTVPLSVTFNTHPGIIPPEILNPAAVVSGSIRLSDNTPLPGVRVLATRPRPNFAGPQKFHFLTASKRGDLNVFEEQITNDAGEFTFDTLGPGDHVIQSFAPGLVTHTQSINAPATDVTFTMTSGTFEIRGMALRYGTNEVLPETSISATIISPPLAVLTTFFSHRSSYIRQLTTVSDFRGRYRFAGLEPGQYLLSARNGQLMQVPVSGLDSKRTYPSGATLSASNPSAEVNLHLYPGHEISGMVCDAHTSKPVSGVRVTVNSPEHHEISATTDVQGRYTLHHVPGAGLNSISMGAEKIGYQRASSRGCCTPIRQVVLDIANPHINLDILLEQLPNEKAEVPG